VLAGSNGAWVSMPSKSQLNADGTAKRKANGKIDYISVLQWRERDVGDRFSEAIVALLLEEHPHALSEDGR
jgi:hypothetical protein